MLKISNRANDITASPIRKFLPLLESAQKRGIKIYKLNVGDPDIKPPAVFFNQIRKNSGGNLGYAPSPGIESHTKAWIKFFSNFKIKFNKKNIIPTVGASEAIIFAMAAVADPGDEIIVFEPLYASYKNFAAMLNIKLVPIRLRMENNFNLPEIAQIEKRITKKTKAIAIINPNNPTGTMFAPEKLKQLGRLANKKNIFIISDETYREIIFSGQPISIFNISGMKKNGILVDSASKRFSMPGARVGCIASYNEDIMAAILRMAQARLSVPSLEQYGLVPILNHPHAYIKKIKAEYKRRRDVVYNSLKSMPGVECCQPQAAFYIIARLRLKNAEDLVRFMLNDFNYKGQTVMMTPAEDFYITAGMGRNEIRLAYVLKTSELKKAMNVLKTGLDQYIRKNY